MQESNSRNTKLINAWCMYDWANSVYNLVITTTFFPIYFAGITKSAYGENTVPLLGRTFKNTALYDYALATAYFIIAIALPVLSSVADSRGNKKKFMQFFTWLGGLACVGLFWFKGVQPSVGWGLFCFMMAAMGYIGSLVFYNSYLPEIAPPQDRDWISARGYSMGYAGSVLLQIIGFGLVLYFSAQGDETSGPRYTFLLVGLWWVGFAQYTFRYLPETSAPQKKPLSEVLQAGFIELRKVWKEVKHMKLLKWFLVAFFFYSMGVQTVMLAATLFGSQVLGLPADKLIITVVLIQLVAIPGAMLMSYLSGKSGNLPVLMGVVLFWILVCVAAYQVATLKESGIGVEFHFYGLAVAVGLVMGGIQSLSRSTYSKLMPETKDTASFFSFYDVTEKIAIVIGIFSFGYIDEVFGMKNSVLALIVFFVLGLLALLIAKKHSRTVQ
ncbi:MAG: MFS transporter [Cyclobacteriaceae bacterium]|nr:MFS transporter [Cyclobacteriaceae bacterium]